jgi:hypothetical protein
MRAMNGASYRSRAFSSDGSVKRPRGFDQLSPVSFNIQRTRSASGVGGRAAFGVVGCPIVYDDKKPDLPFLWSAAERIKAVDTARGHDLARPAEFIDAVCLDLPSSFTAPDVQHDLDITPEEAQRFRVSFFKVKFWWLEASQEIFNQEVHFVLEPRNASGIHCISVNYRVLAEASLEIGASTFGRPAQRRPAGRVSLPYDSQGG